jgi:uncharacterized protein
LQLYLPLAELSLDIFALLAIGLAVGFIAGLFGVGGGFLLTPLIILIGVPPAIAVGTVTAQIAASSASGFLAYQRRGAVDFQLAFVLLIGSLIGSLAGVLIFKQLNAAGHLDLTIAVGFTLLLGLIGYTMLRESLSVLLKMKRDISTLTHKEKSFFRKLPFQMQFKKSNLSLSIIPVVSIGLGIGMLGAILGIGGGFLLVPALIYIIRMPTSFVLGTTLFITLVTMALTTILQAGLTQSIDIMLALPLIAGGVTGAQFGARVSFIMRGEWLRLLLSVLLILVALKFLSGLLLTPDDPFSLVRGLK